MTTNTVCPLETVCNGEYILSGRNSSVNMCYLVECCMIYMEESIWLSNFSCNVETCQTGQIMFLITASSCYSVLSSCCACLCQSVHREVDWFSLIGVIGLLCFAPFIVFYFVMACDQYQCSISQPLFELVGGETTLHSIWARAPSFTWSAAKIYAIWVGFQVSGGVKRAVDLRESVCCLQSKTGCVVV